MPKAKALFHDVFHIHAQKQRTEEHHAHCARVSLRRLSFAGCSVQFVLRKLPCASSICQLQPIAIINLQPNWNAKVLRKLSTQAPRPTAKPFYPEQLAQKNLHRATCTGSLRRATCTEKLAQALCKRLFAQGALCKLLCASCSAPVARRKLLCASCSTKTALRKSPCPRGEGSKKRFRHQKKLISKVQKNIRDPKKLILIDLLLKMKNQRIKKNLFRDQKKLLHFVAGEALSQGQVQISWQARHFRKVGAMLSHVRYRFRGRSSTFARCGTDFAAGAALSQGQVPVSWQAQYFRKVRYRFRSRRSTLARSGTDSRQVQDFRKVRSRFCGRRSTFARGTNFVAGAALSQGTVQTFTQAQHFRKQCEEKYTEIQT